MDAATQTFPTPFVFPSGRACHNFNELARACHDEPAAALQMLREGLHLESFLGTQGGPTSPWPPAPPTAPPTANAGLDEFLGRLARRGPGPGPTAGRSGW